MEYYTLQRNLFVKMKEKTKIATMKNVSHQKKCNDGGITSAHKSTNNPSDKINNDDNTDRDFVKINCVGI